ncbi:uncharacterized protein [Venturia canescens]|uniref:uncharacterized protein n=1 Tax=Venturia canescens TaxID=32260 RepID=UPI001C9C99D3|nr:uncharacterized protein LOC122409713 [Venturia canescens]
MVRDIEWKGTCDNCFCAMGGIRCVPLSCAPPLQGCTPIVREGHCCPSTYNCSGNIEVKAAQNYASYAFISKDYAKFRKETNFYSLNEQEAEEMVGNSTVEGRGHKDAVEQSQSNSTILKTPLGSVDTTKTLNLSSPTDLEASDSMGNLTTLKTNNVTTTFENTTEIITTFSRQDHETMDNEIPTETQKLDKYSNQQETTFSMDWMSNETTEIPTTLETMTSFDSTNVPTTLMNDETISSTNSIGTKEDLLESSVIPMELSTTQTSDITTLDYSGIDYATVIYEEKKMSSLPESSENMKNLEKKNTEKKATTRRVVESTTKFLKVNDIKGDISEVEKDSPPTFGIGESSVISVKGPATGKPTTVLMPDNMLVINVTLKTNVSVGHVQGVTMNPVRSISPDIEAILNITNRKKGEDYDYDYSQPTLPPSLPNVRIIPFVAADALVKQDEEASSMVTNYPFGPPIGLAPQELGPTVTSGTGENFYDIVTQKNRFSPPIETEGGFVPREPLYFDAPFRSTDHNVEIHSGVTVIPADITNPHRKNDGICVFENRNYRHGDLLPSSGRCIICICYYGEVACSDEKCPLLKIGCSRLKNDKICCGKVICVDAEESPTLVLDRADAIAPAPREPLPSLDGMVSPDPFRDVIKTKPAPDLPSLIEDMIPYLVEHRITKAPMSPTTPVTTTNLEPSVVGSFERPPAHRVDPERIELQEIPFINAHALKPSNTNNETSAFDVTNRTDSNDQLHKEALSNPEPIKPALISPSQLLPVPENDEESSIFSFGSVLDLLFSENSGLEGTTETSSYLHKSTSNPTANMSSNPLPDAPATYSAHQPVHLLGNKPNLGFGSSVPTSNPESSQSKFSLQDASESRPNMTLEASRKSAAGQLSSSVESQQNRPSKEPSINLSNAKVPGTISSSSPSKFALESMPKVRINSTSGFVEKLDENQSVTSTSSGNQQLNNSSLSTTITAGMSSDAETITSIKIKEAEDTSPKVQENADTWIKSDSHETTANGSGDYEVVTSASGLLKLAGCNIYGRMYRVGRIITELSSPCLECRCTEVGVQCKQLQC